MMHNHYFIILIISMSICSTFPVKKVWYTELKWGIKGTKTCDRDGTANKQAKIPGEEKDDG